MQQHALAAAALGLLCAGGLLEVGAIGFFGINALVGLCFAGAVAAGLLSRLPGGLTGAVLGTAALVLHIGLLILS